MNFPTSYLLDPSLNDRDVWNVELQFDYRCNAGLPNRPELIEAWLLSRRRKWLEEIERGATPEPEGGVDAAIGRQIENVIKATQIGRLREQEKAEEKEEKDGWLVFGGDEIGLYLEDRAVKALIREAAVGLNLTRRKPQGAKQDIREYCHVESAYPVPFKQRLHFSSTPDTFTPITEPTGFHERPICVDGPTGPRSALKRSDYVEQPYLAFTISIQATRNSRLSDNEMRKVWALAQQIGLGADRSQGVGQFHVTKFSYCHGKGSLSCKGDA